MRSVARQRVQGAGGHARRRGLALAREFHPTAVSLDVFLPDMLGWTVLNHLKQDPATRHIPVQMLTLDEDRQHGLARGAFSFVTKPTTPEGLEAALARIKEYATPRRKRLLVVEDNPAEQLSIRELLGYDDIDVSIAATGTEALAAIQTSSRSTAWCSTCACRICPASRYWNASATLRRSATCRSWCSPAKNCRPRKMPACTRWPAAWW